MPARRLLIWVASVLLVGCTASTTTGETTPAPTSAPATGTPGATSTPQPAGGTIVEKAVATNLDHPATFVLDRTGAIYYGERLTGEIRRIDPKTGKNTSVFTIPGVVGDVSNEQGLVGLTLPPSFPQQPWLYAYATRKVNGVAQDQILRIKMDGDRGKAMQLLLNVQKAGIRHNGGRMLFGPDGMLYVVVGETEQSQLAQDKSVNSGKVLRMTPTGGIPSDNPFRGRGSTPTGIATASGSRSIRRHATCGRRRTGPSATMSSTGSSRAATTAGARRRTARVRRPRTRTATARSRSRRSCSTRRRSVRPGSPSATDATSAPPVKATCSSARSTRATSTRSR